MSIDRRSPGILEPTEYNKESEILYGLPSIVRFCQKCVISNQRPSSTVEYKKTDKTKQETMSVPPEIEDR